MRIEKPTERFPWVSKTVPATECWLPIKLRIKRNRARLEVDLLHERRRLGGAVFAVHSRIFPLDTQGSLIPHVVQRNDDVFEIDIPVAERAEIPVPPWIGERDVP